MLRFSDDMYILPASPTLFAPRRAGNVHQDCNLFDSGAEQEDLQVVLYREAGWLGNKGNAIGNGWVSHQPAATGQSSTCAAGEFAGLTSARQGHGDI